MTLDPEESAQVAELDKQLRERGRRDFLLAFLIGISLILSTGTLIFGLVRSNQHADSAQTKATDAETDAADAKRAARLNKRTISQIEDEVRRQLRKVKRVQRVTNNISRVIDTQPGVPGIQGPFGKTGSPGADGLGPIGPEGPFGVPGADSTVPGPPGADSTIPGPKGEDSTVPGPQGEQGPGPTDEQVAAVVAAYFASADGQAQLEDAVGAFLDGRTFTCQPTADVLDPPTTQTCTLDP